MSLGLNVSDTVPVNLPVPISLTTNLKLYCASCKDVHPVSDREGAFNDIAILACGHRRGRGLPKAAHLIGLEDLVSPIDPLTGRAMPTERNILAQKLFPATELAGIRWEAPMSQKMRAKRHAKLQAAADAMLEKAGFGELVEQSKEFDAKDEPEDRSDFHNGYQFSKPEQINYDDYEGTWNVSRSSEVSFDDVDEIDPSDYE